MNLQTVRLGGSESSAGFVGSASYGRFGEPSETFTSVEGFSPPNCGFAQMANRSLRACFDRFPQCQLVLVLSADVVIDDSKVKLLGEAMLADPNIGCIGPLLRFNDSGSVVAGGTLGRSGRARHCLHRNNRERENPPRGEEVDWIDGSIMLFRRAALESVRLPNGMYFAEDRFMYVEEVDLHERLRAVGWKVCVDRSVEAAQSSGMAKRPGAHGYLITRNTILMNARRYGLPGTLGAVCLGFATAANQLVSAFRTVPRGRINYGRRHHLKQAVGMMLGVVHGIGKMGGAPPRFLRSWGDITGDVPEPFVGGALALSHVSCWYWGRKGGGVDYTQGLVQHLRELGIAVNETRERNPALLLLRSIPGPWSLGAQVRRSGATAVIHTMVHPFSLAALQTLRPLFGGPGRKTKLLVVAHDAAPHPGEGKPFLWWMIHWVYNRADVLVALSDHVAQQLSERYPKARIEVVPHPPFSFGSSQNTSPSVPVTAVTCDIEMSSPDACSVPEARSSRSALFLGRILPYKGLPLLAQAWRLVLQTIPDAVLNVCGEGSIEPSLLADLDALGVRVQNHWLSHEDIRTAFDSCDVVIAPYVEASQSGVVASARSFGKPVIVTNVGGLVEQVNHQIDGLICDPTPRALADAIVRLFKDDALLHDLATGSSDVTLRPEQSWQSVATRFADICALSYFP
jgi:glycosyltransferase involved in cell wall biosynthesis/GT2 family glycosyltransferase